MKNYVKSVKELSKELGINVKETQKLVRDENNRLWREGVPRYICNPCKRWYTSSRIKVDTYNVSYFKRLLDEQ